MSVLPKPASAEESALRGVLARAFLNILRERRTHVGIILDVQTDAPRAIRHLESLAHSLGFAPSKPRLVNGSERFSLEHGGDIYFMNRRSAVQMIRGFSLDVLYLPSDWPTEDRLEAVLPALSSRAGELEFY